MQSIHSGAWVPGCFFQPCLIIAEYLRQAIQPRCDSRASWKVLSNRDRPVVSTVLVLAVIN